MRRHRTQPPQGFQGDGARSATAFTSTERPPGSSRSALHYRPARTYMKTAGSLLRSRPPGGGRAVSEQGPWCHSCGAQYLPHITTCPDCGVPLVEAPPGPADHETTPYDLSGTTGAQRRLVEMLLRGAGIPCSWEGTTVIVPHVAEAQVDDLLEQLDIGDDEATDEEVGRRADVELRIDTLERLGTAMYCGGAVGIAVAIVQGMSTADLLGGSDDNLLRQVAYVLGSYSTVLFSALVIAVGALCRFCSAWARLRLEDRALT